MSTATRKKRPSNLTVWPHNAATIDALREFMARHPEQDQKEIAKGIGRSPAQVSLYLGYQPDGSKGYQSVTERPLREFEALIEAHIRRHDIRIDTEHEIFSTSIHRKLDNLANSLTATRQPGMAYGPAGIGKTTWAQMRIKKNAGDIYAPLSAWSKGEAGFARAVAYSLGGKCPGNKNRMEWIVERVRDTGRLLIVDTGQRMNVAARRLLFDFYDATKNPLLVLGNPQILHPYQRGGDEERDQFFSRLGKCRPQEYTEDMAREDAPRLVAAVDARLVGHVEPEAVEIATKRGHLRTLRNVLIAAGEILDKSPQMEPAKAFLTAYSFQIQS
jgi:DNA transposition AAA+ family ATPase